MPGEDVVGPSRLPVGVVVGVCSSSTTTTTTTAVEVAAAAGIVIEGEGFGGGELGEGEMDEAGETGVEQREDFGGRWGGWG